MRSVFTTWYQSSLRSKTSLILFFLQAYSLKLSIISSISFFGKMSNTSEIYLCYQYHNCCQFTAFFFRKSYSTYYNFKAERIQLHRMVWINQNLPQKQRYMQFMPGTSSPPTVNDPKFAAWDVHNSIVMSWLLHSMQPEIKKHLSLTGSHKGYLGSNLFDLLKERHGRSSIWLEVEHCFHQTRYQIRQWIW